MENNISRSSNIHVGLNNLNESEITQNNSNYPDLLSLFSRDAILVEENNDDFHHSFNQKENLIGISDNNDEITNFNPNFSFQSIFNHSSSLNPGLYFYNFISPYSNLNVRNFDNSDYLNCEIKDQSSEASLVNEDKSDNNDSEELKSEHNQNSADIDYQNEQKLYDLRDMPSVSYSEIHTSSTNEHNQNSADKDYPEAQISPYFHPNLDSTNVTFSPNYAPQGYFNGGTTSPINEEKEKKKEKKKKEISHFDPVAIDCKEPQTAGLNFEMHKTTTIKKTSNEVKDKEKKEEEQKLSKNPDRNIFKVLLANCVKVLRNGLYSYKIESLSIKNPKLLYPYDFYKYTNKKNFDLFLDNLLIVCRNHLNLKLLKAYWMLPFKEEGLSDFKIFFCKPKDKFEWLSMHFHWCVKNFYENFLEDHAYDYLINKKERPMKDIKLYLKNIPKWIRIVKKTFSIHDKMEENLGRRKNKK